ncbi:MAG TPA: hypothetical protein VF885_16755 [Arthrobacter sp.]
MNTQITQETPEQLRARRTQAAIDLLAREIVDNGYEMLGDQIYHEPQWSALQDVANSVGAFLTKPKYEHGAPKGGQVECPLAGDWWAVITTEGQAWCDGCQQDLPAQATEPAPATPTLAPAAGPIEVSVYWHERGTYRAREEVDVEDFRASLRGESPYGGIPADPKGIFTDLAESGTVSQYEARIREAMADEGRQGALAALLESYFTDNLPDSSSSYVKTLDGSNEVDAIRFTD